MSSLTPPGSPSTDPEPALASDVTRVQVRGSSLLLVGQVVAIGINLITQVLLVRYLSKTSFGAFAYALSIVSLAETVAAFGLRRGVSRFVPIYEERDDPRRAAGALVFALGSVLGLGVAVVLVVIGLRTAIADPVATEPEAVLLLAILIVLAPVQALENLLDGAFAVFARPRVIFARRYLYTPLMRLSVVGMLVLSSSGVTFLAFGYMAAGVLGVLLYAALLVRVLHERQLLEWIRRRQMIFPVRDVLGFTVPLLTNDVTAALMNAAGAVLLGILAGAADVADLRAVFPISLTLTYVLGAFGTLFVPLASRLYARGDAAELSRLYWSTAGWTAVLSFPVFALAFAFGEQLTVLLFGEQYADAGLVLSALVLGHFVTAAMGPNGVLLAVFGQVRYIVVTNIVAVSVNLALALALIPFFGALGAAISTSATLIVLNVIRQVGLGWRTPVQSVDRRYVSLYVVLGALVGMLVAADAVLSPPLLVGGLMVGVAWVLALLFTRRELALDETFPELRRVPGLGLVLGGRRSQP